MKYLLASVAAAALLCSTTAQAEEANAGLDAAIESYILKHPDVLVKSLKSYRGKEKVSAEQVQGIAKDPSIPVLGNPNGDVTVVEFFDYHCGYCKRFFPTMSQLITEDTNLKVLFVELPIISEDSEIASKAALAVHSLDKSKYFAFHTALMKLSGKFEESKMISLAKQAGLDEAQFTAEMRSEKIAKQIEANKSLARLMEVQATPTMLIGDNIVPGAVDIGTMKNKISMLRSKGGNS